MGLADLIRRMAEAGASPEVIRTLEWVEKNIDKLKAVFAGKAK